MNVIGLLGIISIFNDTNITTIQPQYNKIPNSQKAAGRFIQKHLTCILKTKMYYECLRIFLFNAYVH